VDPPASTAAAPPATPPRADPGGAPVDDDVAAALAGLGARAIAAVRITGLPSARSDKAAFRVTLADGRVVKVRRLTRAAKAERYAGLARALGSERLAPILAVAGRVCVEAWIDGAPLAALPASPARLAAAADLLGSLHATQALGGRSVRGRRATTRLVARAERQLGKLAAAGRLAPPAAAALARALRRGAPPHAATGLTHHDVCAENLVEDAAGRVIAVDNEGLRLDFLDFDLARTWARWPMPEPEWRAFAARYAAWRGEPPDPAAQPFWRIAAILKSAHLRSARAPDHAGVPLRRLAQLLDALERR
jgi:hypothetical protein